jgi:hypothetical protein
MCYLLTLLLFVLSFGLSQDNTTPDLQKPVTLGIDNAVVPMERVPEKLLIILGALGTSPTSREEFPPSELLVPGAQEQGYGIACAAVHKSRDILNSLINESTKELGGELIAGLTIIPNMPFDMFGSLIELDSNGYLFYLFADANDEGGYFVIIYDR